MRRRCVFLDRDGVINVAPPAGGYVLEWSEFYLIPGVVDWIRLFNALGLLSIVITNQRCVARGLASAEEIDEIHRRMCAELDSRGARIDDVFCCPHAENACRCRKPDTGLVEAAVRKWEIELAGSLLIGDGPRDEELAHRCHIPFVQVRGGSIVRVVDPGTGT